MVRPKRKTTTTTRHRRNTKRALISASMSTSASAAKVPSLDIKSSADVKKALEIMQKFPLTIILVFASWCPHCHTYMKEWNKYKSLPNRTSPMVSVENNNSAELFKHLRGSKGEEVAVNAFPTVFVSKPSNNATNMVEPISTSDRSSMVTLLNKGSEAVSNEPAATFQESPMFVEKNVAGSANISTEAPESGPGSSNNYLSNSMGSINDYMGSAESAAASNSNSLQNASNFTESIRTTGTNASTRIPSNGRNGTNAQTNATSAGVTPFRKATGLSKAVKNAVRTSTQRRRNVASASASASAAASNSILSPINRFAKPPRKEQSYNLISGGGNGNSCGATALPGGPSGLIKLQGGGLAPNGSLYAALSQYAAAITQTRKNSK